MIIYIDLDDTLAEFTKEQKKEQYNNDLYPQNNIGFYENIEPIIDGIDALFKLINNGHHVYILTGASPCNLHSYSEKAKWIIKHIGFEFLDKLIISQNKALFIGDIIIDNNIEGRNVENFKGKLIHYKNNWNEILEEIL